jgi:hypothetical protein
MQWRKAYNTFQEMLNDIHPDNGMDIDTGHQVNVAKAKAIDLISTAVVGDPEGDDHKDFTILLEGNANVEHKMPEGGQKDFITITVRQK